MPNKLKVLVVGKNVGRSAAYEIAGTVSAEMNCLCQADVEVKSISDRELKMMLELLKDEAEKGPHCADISGLIKKLTPSPIEEDE